jgi:hypothetical protein
MKLSDKTIALVNRYWIISNVVLITGCIWSILGVNVSWKYEVDLAFGVSREQLLSTMTSYLKETEFLLWACIAVLVINIVIVSLNQRHKKGAA